MKKLTIFNVILIAGLFLFNGCEETARENPFAKESEAFKERTEKLQAKSTTKVGPKNIRIILDKFTATSSDFHLTDGIWELADENLTEAARPKEFKESGFKAALSTSNILEYLIVLNKQIDSAKRSRLHMSVGIGADGYMNIGNKINVQGFSYSGKLYNKDEHDFQKTKRFFKVSAHLRDDKLIEMEITPILSGLMNTDNPYKNDIEMTDLSIKVVTKSGQGLLLAAANIEQEGLGNAFFKYGEEGESRQSLILITPHHIDPSRTSIRPENVQERDTVLKEPVNQNQE